MIKHYPKPSEHQSQCALVQWFRIRYPKWADCFFAIPNGAVLCDLPDNKRKARMRYLIKEGFKVGVSDLFLAVPTRRYCGLWLEMKKDGATQRSVTLEQQAHLTLMSQQGYAAVWCAGFEDAQQTICNYLDDEG